MLKKACLLSALLSTAFLSHAQTTFLQIGSEDNHVLDRLETRSGRLSDTLCTGDKPESRRNAISFLESLVPPAGSDSQAAKYISKIDWYNIEQMVSESGEWARNENGAINSKLSWFNTFYTKQYDLAYVKTNNFFVVANPVLSGIGMYAQNTPQPEGLSHQLITNSQGAELRGWIAKKIGFYTSVVDNQEQYPYFLLKSVTDPRHQNVPGADYFLPPGIATGATGRYDYLQASGYVNFDAVKNHVNVSFGSGKHFLGDGISSLFLTDYSSNMPFLQLQTRIWHINYECLYLELTPQYDKNQGDGLIAHKYSTIHYLTWNTCKWLNLGFFEAEVFDRPNTYELSYLNPIIFSTAINRFNGEGDKSILGMSAKAIVAKHLQFYGQLMFNEFRAKELISSKGWYGNKWGIQAGGKYFDAYSKVVSDEAILTKVLAAGENPERQGQNSPVMKAIMIEKMWGTAGPIAAKVDGDAKPLFDYKSEVEKAKSDYADLVAKAGLLPAMPVLGKDNALASLEAEPAKLWSPQMPNATINARGETVTKFYRVVPGIVLHATDENGKVVVPGPGAARRVSASGASGYGPSNNEPMTKFNLSISVPKGPKSFKEIKGMFGIVVADGAEEADLGMIDFKTGAKGPTMGFTFSDVSKVESEFRMGNGPAQKQINTSITANFDLKVNAVQIKILDATGKVLLSWDTDSTRQDKTYHMQTNTQFPEKVQVKIVSLKNPRVIDIPFEFGDVPVEETKH